MNNEEAGIETDFSPLFEAMHINETLGKADQFRVEYAADRRTQKDLIIPTKLNLLDEECSDLSSLLESIAGFAIIEKATISKTTSLRQQSDVSALYLGSFAFANACIGRRVMGFDVHGRYQSHLQGFGCG